MFHSRDMEAPLQAPLSVKFDYTRSLGPVLSAFFTGIREGYFVGARTSLGVMVPPPEFDPNTLEPITEFVELPGSGVVQSWSWVSVPVAGQPFSHPFAFALITLDGADTPLLHAVDAGSPDLMHTVGDATVHVEIKRAPKGGSIKGSIPTPTAKRARG